MAADYTKINENRRIANEDIYEEVSDELGIDIRLVKEVVDANSAFTRKTIETGGFESITFPYLGKVKAKLRSIQKATANIRRS